MPVEARIEKVTEIGLDQGLCDLIFILKVQDLGGGREVPVDLRQSREQIETSSLTAVESIELEVLESPVFSSDRLASEVVSPSLKFCDETLQLEELCSEVWISASGAQDLVRNLCARAESRGGERALRRQNFRGECGREAVRDTRHPRAIFRI